MADETFQINSNRPAIQPALMDGIPFQAGIIPNGTTGVTTPSLIRDAIFPVGWTVINDPSELPLIDTGDGLGVIRRTPDYTLITSPYFDLGIDPIGPLYHSQRAVITGSYGNTIAYSGPGDMFRTSLTSNWLELIVTNIILLGVPTNSIINFTGDWTQSVLFFSVLLYDFGLDNSINNALYFLTKDSVAIVTSGRFLLNDNLYNISSNVSFISVFTNSDALVKISGTSQNEIIQTTFVPAGPGDYGLYIGPAAGGNTTMILATFDGTYGGEPFAPGSLTPASPNVRGMMNPGVKSSSVSGMLYFQDNVVETEIRATDEWSAIAGSTLTKHLERCEIVRNGLLRFTNLEVTTINPTITGSVQLVGGGTNTLEIALFETTGVSKEITGFVDAGGGLVTVTSVSHGLPNGAAIVIVGSTSYESAFIVFNSATDAFDIYSPYTAEAGAGIWHEMEIVPDSSMTRETSSVVGPFSSQSIGDVVNGSMIQLYGRNKTLANNIILPTKQIGFRSNA